MRKPRWWRQKFSCADIVCIWHVLQTRAWSSAFGNVNQLNYSSMVDSILSACLYQRLTNNIADSVKWKSFREWKKSAQKISTKFHNLSKRYARTVQLCKNPLATSALTFMRRTKTSRQNWRYWRQLTCSELVTSNLYLSSIKPIPISQQNNNYLTRRLVTRNSAELANMHAVRACIRFLAACMFILPFLLWIYILYVRWLCNKVENLQSRTLALF
jgi:hypothetical protein